MRTINLYWVFAGRRILEAQAANSFPSAEDAAFLVELYNDIEVARMENAVIQVTPADWRRVLSMIPDAKPLQPPRIKDQPSPGEIAKPFVPSSTAPITGSKVETHMTDVPATSPVSAVSGAPDNVVEMHPPLKDMN